MFLGGAFELSQADLAQLGRFALTDRIVYGPDLKKMARMTYEI
jgi:hypothetical protein